MKILQITRYSQPVPPPRYGGVERYLDWLVRGLVEEGHEVDLIANQDSTTPATRLIPYSRNASTSDVVKLIKSLEPRWSEYDIIHEHGTSRIFDNFPRYIWSNSDSESHVFDKYKNKVHHTKLQAVAEGLPEYAGINLGVPTDEYLYDSEKNDYLVYTSLLSTRHGADLAVQAAIQSKTKVIFIGDMNNGINSEGMEKFIRPNLGPYVDVFDMSPYTPEIGNIKKQQLVAKAKGALLPTRDTTFGIVLLEALCAGTPCIIYKDDNPVSFPPSEVITHGETGWVCTSTDQLVEGCRLISSLSPAKCRDRAEKFFSYQVMTKNYLDLYKEIINGRTW